MTCCHFTMSFAMSSPNAAGGPPAVINPYLANVPATSGERRNALIAVL
jgi:hypothetical protein